MAGRGGLDAAPALRWSREAAARGARGARLHRGGLPPRPGARGARAGGARRRPASGWRCCSAPPPPTPRPGALGAAQERYEQAAALARRLGDADAFAQAALGYAEFQHYGEVDAAALALLEEARGRLDAGASVLRAQVLGRLAVRLDPTTEQPRREALLDEAIAMARAVGDPAALARLLALSPLVNWRPQSSARRHADAAEVLALAAAGGDREAALWAHIVLHTERFADGDIAGADAELADYDRLAGELRQRYYRWYGKVLHATRAIFDGRLEAGRALAAEAVADNREHEQDSEQEWVVQQLLLARIEGRPEDVPLDALREFAARYAALPVWRALLATGEWVAGNREAARAAIDDCAPRGPAALPADVDLPCTLALLADVSASLGELRHAVELRACLEPYAARNVLTDRSWAAWGAAARPLGRLAAALGDAARRGRPLRARRRAAPAAGARARGWRSRSATTRRRSPGAAPRSSRRARRWRRRLGLQPPSSTKPAQ